MPSHATHFSQTQTKARAFRARARSAFTLMEILAVLFIAAMITGALAIGYVSYADEKFTTPDDVFWSATTAARKQALLSGREARLAYAPASASDGEDAPAGLVITWAEADGTPGEQRFAFEKMGDVICEFLTTQRGAQSIMVGGELIETQTIPHMTFYGDGTCTPVRIQMRRNTGGAHTLNIDPWTCAQMLTRDESTQ
jgi:general secretion pathway protein H